MLLVVGRHHPPRRHVGGRAAYHLLDGHRILVPLFAVAEILIAELPALARLVKARQEALHLHVGRQVQKYLHYAGAVVGQKPFEFVDLVIGALPFGIFRKPLHPLDQDPAVPGTVEHRDRAVRRQSVPEPLQIVSLLILRPRCPDGPHLEAARIHGRRQPLDCASLAGCVPAFEDDHCPFARVKIGLLYALQRQLKRFEMIFIGLFVGLPRQVDIL